MISLAISLGIGYFTWQRRHVAGAWPFALSVVAQSSMIVGYILELSSETLGAKIFWDDMQWIGAVITPPLLLRFALEFSGRTLPGGKKTWRIVWLVPK